jgi:hypothetical protein
VLHEIIFVLYELAFLDEEKFGVGILALDWVLGGIWI